MDKTQKRIFKLLALSILFSYVGGTVLQLSVRDAAAHARRLPPFEKSATAAEVEPNNTPAQATPINLIVQQLSSMTGAIDVENDVDYFSFSATPGAKLWAYVDTGGPRAPLSRDNSLLTLYDSDGTSVIEEDDDDGLGTGLNGVILSSLASVIGGRTLPGSPGANRTYYLRVKSKTTDRLNPYTLYVILTNSPAPAEVEPNNSAEMANQIMAADALFGLRAAAINPAGDADFFSFQANANDIFFFSADGDPERDGASVTLDVELRSATGNIILMGGNSVSDPVLNPYTAEGFCYQLTAAGTYFLRVSGHNNETGTYTLLTSRAPAASTVVSISGINPTSAPVGGTGLILTVNGTNFINGSVVRFNGQDRTTTFVSATQLTAELTAADLATASTANITVFNPGTGGGLSNTVSFSINNPSPTLTSIAPNTVTGGGAGFLLTLNGTNFVPASVVRFNGQVRQTFYTSPTQLTANLLASDISTAGQAAITVFNSPPAGGISNEVTLTINLPSGGFEGDVSPRPNGNGSVSIADWVQVGRFTAALETPAAGSEFQRVDTAPRETRGNGILNMADWVQTGRYAAGMDPVQAAGGPTTPASLQATASLAGLMGREPGTGQGRQARLVNLSPGRGSGHSLTLEFDARGEENAISLSLEFDPLRFTFESATSGEGFNQALLIVNANEAARGLVGLAFALPPGQGLSAGRHRVIVLKFKARSDGAAGVDGIGVGDYPIARQVVDTRAAEVPASWTGGRGGASLNRAPVRPRSDR